MSDPSRTRPGTGKPIVLVLMGGYWPGHDASGPNQSLRQMVDALCNEFDFRIVARDRAKQASGSAAPGGRWIDAGPMTIRYCPVTGLGAAGLGGILRDTPHDILALNGFFDREFTIPALTMRRLGAIPLRPTVLSARGEMSDGALGLKPWRKRAYLAACRQAALLRDVWVHATSETEFADIKSRLPGVRGHFFAPNVRRLVAPSPAVTPMAPTGRVRLVFVGRIARVKNLHFACDVLARVRVPVVFDVYGPTVEPDYAAALAARIGGLPSNIAVRLWGAIANDEVARALSGADLLFLPTLGENFGHAIFEALSCGLPVLISDRTPWRDLERLKAGWDLPLDDPGAFARVIESVPRLRPAERRELRRGARALAERFERESDGAAAHRRMFRTLLADAGPRSRRIGSAADDPFLRTRTERASR